MAEIVHLITDTDVGGAEMMLLNLLKSVNEKRQDHIVVSMLEGGKLVEEFHRAAIPVFSLGMSRNLRGITALYRLCTLLRKEKPKILQTWMYHADLMGWVAARLCGISHVVWNLRCSHINHPIKTRVLIRVLKFLSGRPDAIIANSECGKAFHHRIGYRPKQWMVIPNGFDVDSLKPLPEECRLLHRDRLGIQRGSFVFGMAARYEPVKGHGHLIRAMAQLLQSPPERPVQLVLAGREIHSSNRHLMTLLNDRLPRHQYVLLDEISNIQDFMSTLDVYVSPSEGEGFPNVVGEAMSCGIPCIVTDVGDSAQLVQSTGMIVPPGNPQALAESMKRMMEMSTQVRCEWGKKARERIVGHYSIQSVSRNYRQFYQRLLDPESRNTNPAVGTPASW